jgi:rhomboid protease GluP
MSIMENPLPLPPPLPPLAASAAAEETASTPATTAAFPLVTMALLSIMVALFAGEVLLGVDKPTAPLALGLHTLMAFGGLQYVAVVEQGQWFRLLTAPLLHADPLHILFNGIAFYLAGRVLEPLIGRLWYAALFAIGGIAGSLMSLAVNPHNMVSVGASGAIMALFAAMFVFSIRVPIDIDRRRLQRTAMQVLVPSLLPLTGGLQGAHIDYGAHFGGAIAGIIVAGLLLALWRREQIWPPARRIAQLIVAVAAIATGLSVVPDVRGYHYFVLDSFMIPPSELAGGTDAAVAHAQSLVKDYPRDPRSHFYLAIADLRANDLMSAETEVRTALAQDEVLRVMLQPSFKIHMEASLALILADENRPDDAKQMARSGCADANTPLYADLVKRSLCQ